METYRPPRAMKWIALVSLAVFVGFLGLSAALPWLDDGDNIVTTSIILSVFWLGFISFTSWALWNLPRAGVVTDDTGIWEYRLPRHQGLLRWQDIAAVRAGWQSLIVQNAAGDHRVRIDRHLQDSESLRRRVLDHLVQTASHDPYGTYRKGSKVSIGMALGALAFLAGAIAAGYYLHWLVGIAVLAYGVWLVYLDHRQLVRSMTIDPKGITITYDQDVRLPYEEIQAVDYTDVHDSENNRRHPTVVIHTNDQQYTLRKADLDAPNLYIRLQQARARATQ